MKGGGGPHSNVRILLRKEGERAAPGGEAKAGGRATLPLESSE